MTGFDFRFPSETQIGLAVCCDWHLGSHTADQSAVKEWIETIKREGWHVMLGGDLLEMSLTTSVGDVYEQMLTPMQQIDLACSMLDPIKEQILWGVGGNHSQRVIRAVGIDPDLMIARELGCGYDKYMAAGRIQVGEAHWKVGLTHGAGGGGTVGSKLNTANKMGKVYHNLDLYLSGHTHADVSNTDTTKDIVLNRGSVNVISSIRRFSGCGSLLTYEDSYAEAKIMPPANKCQVVHFLGDRKRIRRNGVLVTDKSYKREVFHF